MLTQMEEVCGQLLCVQVSQRVLPGPVKQALEDPVLQAEEQGGPPGARQALAEGLQQRLRSRTASERTPESMHRDKQSHRAAPLQRHAGTPRTHPETVAPQCSCIMLPTALQQCASSECCTGHA